MGVTHAPHGVRSSRAERVLLAAATPLGEAASGAAIGVSCPLGLKLAMDHLPWFSIESGNASFLVLVGSAATVAGALAVVHGVWRLCRAERFDSAG